MFRIRKILDNISSANRESIAQVLTIVEKQFPLARTDDFIKLPQQLNDPLKYQYRSILLVGEDALGKVKGFAMLLHMADVGIGFLEMISAAPGRTGGGIGSALYEAAREECLSLKVKGLFFECAVDDGARIHDADTLKQNRARLRFYERYAAYPIVNNVYDSPVNPGDQDLYYLVFDALGKSTQIKRADVHAIVRAILQRKYGDLIPAQQIDEVVASFQDKTLSLRAPQYVRKPVAIRAPSDEKNKIALVVNEGHSIHHVKDRGYVEAPVRLSSILKALDKSQLFKRIPPARVSEKQIKQVHLPAYVDYLRRACEQLSPGKSIYPIIFPPRNVTRPPKDIELQVGYYCLDTFTPLNHNAYHAARGAVDCAVTAANAVLAGYPVGYALVRPPGHHAERRAFGGFCYFNSAAIAAQHLSRFGKVAMLDIDFHHGNGAQDIFYERSDVLTLSIHGDPHFAYPHFAGFKDEQGAGEGLGFNVNYPLAEHITAEQYRRCLTQALKRIKQFDPLYLVVCLGLDTAKADPTGTWSHGVEDFHQIGRLIGKKKWPVLVVQEGGYRTQTLGSNARGFFEGLWAGLSEK